MSDLLYRDEIYQIVTLCMEVHRELGHDHDEIIYQDALELEFRRFKLPYVRDPKHGIEYKGALLPHHYQSDFILFDKILFVGKACERLTEAHVRRVQDWLAISKLPLALLVNFGEESLAWKRVIRAEPSKIESVDFRNPSA